MSGEVHSIFIDKTWYVQVDAEGYVKEFCAEGALGCVVPLRKLGDESLGDDQPRRALKIPRLLGDTWRENAFVDGKTEAERRVVEYVYDGGPTPGLIIAHLGLDLRGVRELQACPDPSAREKQDGGIVFVSFDKQRSPRFCNVRMKQGQLSVEPPGLRALLEPVLRPEVWDKLEKDGRFPPANLPFQHSVYCGDAPPSIAVPSGRSLEVGALIRTMNTRKGEVSWFAGIPSIAYEWAPSTLQESIGRGIPQQWSTDEVLALLQMIAKGLDSLHSRQLVHGDLRPANIMCVTPIVNHDQAGQTPAQPAGPEEMLRSPQNYRIGDYGSFSEEHPHAEAMHASSDDAGLTVVAPDIDTRRSSPFYAPERRSGTERESADTALVLKVDGYYLIRLGWRTEIFDEQRSHARPETVEDCMRELEALKSMIPGNGHDVLVPQRRDTSGVATDSPVPSAGDLLATEALRAGDRVRIRDYIFEVVAATRSETWQTLLCSERFACVMHDRLAVYTSRGPKSANERSLAKNGPEILSIPRYVEYRKWSAATDLYSLGAITLYCLLPTKDPDSKESLDIRFAQLLEVLETVPYFRCFWAEIDAFCSSVEELFEKNRTLAPGEVPKQPAPALSGTTVPDDWNLFKLAGNVVNNIVQSAPHCQALLGRLNWNMAHFLFVVRFIMACLHRKQHVMQPARASSSMPFCEDRLEAPMKNGPASRAIHALKQLEALCGSNAAFLSSFVAKEQDIPKYRPTSDFLIRLENESLKRESVALKETVRNEAEYLRDQGDKAPLISTGGSWRQAFHAAAERLLHPEVEDGRRSPGPDPEGGADPRTSRTADRSQARVPTS